jgi:adenine-specific DNA methylase
MLTYPKRLIEIDLPIARISAHARREKSIRHGHISTLHIWWARRPLAACRAVICGALWPDPADPLCPQSFRDAAARHLVAFAKRVNPEKITDEKRQLQASLSPESRTRWEVFTKGDPSLDPTDPAHQNVLRFALLDFIADFANWDNSTVPAYLETSRSLTQAAHEALGGEPGTRPLVVDPFAGGGSIPLEALRVGADAFASDLNPVAVLLNKVVLEYIPKYGQRLAEEVRKWGAWIKEQAEKELAEFYPKDPDGATPIAYLWARTIRCEGVGCGAEVPLIRTLSLAARGDASVALRMTADEKVNRVSLDVVQGVSKGEVGSGTMRSGAVNCPLCGYTTPSTKVREQLTRQRGGSSGARLLAVVLLRDGQPGRIYRTATDRDLEVAQKARLAHERLRNRVNTSLSPIPDEPIASERPSPNSRGLSAVTRIGMQSFGDVFTHRQSLALATLADLVCAIARKNRAEHDGLGTAVATCLALVVGRVADRCSSLCRYDPSPTMSGINNTFARQALSITWDFGEGNPISERSGGWEQCLQWLLLVLEHESSAIHRAGTVQACSATVHPLPDDIVDSFVTDPPYYDAIPYADLSDFFYVWLRRSLEGVHSELLDTPLVPKDEEAIWNPSRICTRTGQRKDESFYESQMASALREGRRIARPKGVGVVVFAHKSTAGWEALLSALIESGWIVTASWPIDTEMTTRVAARGQARLSSSVHLVCRPREIRDESISANTGDWRDILSELPQRMHEWMPRLASEGVVGADAIFACLGPALEIFSRYEHVEKANGDRVLLKEYLEHVWAAVSKEALSTIFRDADASGLEPDARLTAMWLWTIGSGAPAAYGKPSEEAEADDEGAEDEAEGNSKPATASGFVLEFDAARKIAQGLGIHLERSESIIEIKGDKARLRSVAERTEHLFGKDSESNLTGSKKTKKKPKQLSLFEELDEVEETGGGWKELKGPPPGTTILDRLHQAMILFGAQRGGLLKRFLVEDGVGKDARFWKLAQSLAALYPPGTDERRWVEGVLARKKGLGL